MENIVIPKEIEEGAALAEQLHAQLFPQTSEDVAAIETDESAAVVGEPAQEVVETPVVVESKEDEDTYKQRFQTLKGMQAAELKQLRAELNQLKQENQRYSQNVTTQQVTNEISEKKTAIRNQLADYPQELVEGIINYLKLEQDERDAQVSAPIRQEVANIVETQQKMAQDNFVKTLDAQSSTWQPIWDVAAAAKYGGDMSSADPAIIDFLRQPDPSGLYTNYDLIHMYNEQWNADKLASVCNMFAAPVATTPPQQKKNVAAQNAIVAPTRTRSQPAPVTDSGIQWSSSSFEQFTRDDAAGKFSPSESQALWNDANRALKEGQFRI